MNKLVINKDFLSKSKNIIIGFENCDAYIIESKDVLDIYCKAMQIEKTQLYRTDDGYIKISSNASQNKEVSLEHNQNLDGTECDICFEQRLCCCGSGVDITSFSLAVDELGTIEVYVPYDPLESALTRGELDLSNCPSAEVDDDGNMLIYFGKSSKQPTRKDNDYPNLVLGWREAFGDYSPKVLSAKALGLASFGEKQNNLSLTFETSDRKLGKRTVEFLFFECFDTRIQANFPLKGKCKIIMSKMADGTIYVAFDGLGMEFFCTSIYEYEYYCAQDEE